MTVLLLAVLAFTRLVELEKAEELVSLNNVVVAEIAPPPPPQDLSEPELEDELPDPVEPPPVAPALDVPIEAPSIDVTTVPLSLTRLDLSTPLQSFHTDIEVADITVRKAVVRPVSKPAKIYTPTNSKKTPTKPKLPPKPVVKKEVYSTSELDSIPRARRTGRFSWPSRAKGRHGEVRLLLEISTSGRVSVIKVLSTTDSALSAAAKKVATGSLYTSPTYKGKPVKTQFYKTYKLQKP